MEGVEGLNFYWSPVSQPSRSVKVLLDIGNVPVNLVTIDLGKGEHKGEEYTKINKRGLLPYIRDGDFNLGESNAILKYLADTRDTIPETWWPKDGKKRAEVDQYLEWY